jgi:hypothetical protein
MFTNGTSTDPLSVTLNPSSGTATTVRALLLRGGNVQDEKLHRDTRYLTEQVLSNSVAKLKIKSPVKGGSEAGGRKPKQIMAIHKVSRLGATKEFRASLQEDLKVRGAHLADVNRLRVYF